MAQTQTQIRTQANLSYPKRFNVIIWNDDFTPMEFVIQLLVEVFNKTVEQSSDITLEIHNEGKAVAGVYSKEIAEQKAHEATVISRHSGHPLSISCEPCSD
jgi:ATP-dependent Clp protease adaptor protein ClpS